ncbi:MAG: lytic transglycosylase domain-containing protein [Deltaproteobacteria bacterium]|nr:lytic transglycosylase domain-containing protein [Deltaproteobacteria bacterium]
MQRLKMNITLLQTLAGPADSDAAGLDSGNWVGSVWWPHLIRSIELLERTSLNPADTISRIIEDAEPSFTLPSRQDFDELIEKAAGKTGLDANLVKAVIKAESNFDPRVESDKGARGLMQIMPGTAGDLGIANAFDPAQNIEGGCRYLKQMLDRYSGNLNQALAAYNWGPGNLDRSKGGLPAETRTYIERVNRYYNQFSAMAKA